MFGATVWDPILFIVTYRNLISSCSRFICIFFWVMFAPGDVYGVFILAYFGSDYLGETISGKINVSIAFHVLGS